MFEHWGEFYLMAGGAAAVLIGLIFVVISLMHDRPRSTVLTGSKLYMGPIVLGISFVLVLASAALTPGIDRDEYAPIAGVVAAWGLVRGLMSIDGIRGLVKDDRPLDRHLVLRSRSRARSTSRWAWWRCRSGTTGRGRRTGWPRSSSRCCSSPSATNGT